MKLLNIDANAKTIKGQKVGFLTAVLYLAPFKMSGINVCPMAELAGCWRGCLNTAGRGGIAKGRKTMRRNGITVPDNAIQRCRINRTRLYAKDRDGFMAQLVKEIRAFLKRADRKGLTPAIRLNGTSDIRWENQPVTIDGQYYDNLFDAFSDVTFYDYTKLPNRFNRVLPSNYHLSLSFSNASQRYADMCWDAHAKGASLVMVYRSKLDVTNARTWFEECRVPCVDGDANDLRFLDPDKCIVTLKAKGKARKDTSGFVLDFE
jgi:hypothetical protein